MMLFVHRFQVTRIQTVFLNLVYFCDTFIEQFWLRESLEAIFLEIKSVLLYLLQRSPDDPAFLVIDLF